MSTWRINDNEVEPQDYLKLIYNIEKGNTQEETDEELELEDDEDETYDLSAEAPIYSSLTFPEHRGRSPLTTEEERVSSFSPSRERSPLRETLSSETSPTPADLLMRIYEEEDMVLDGADDDAFLAPDTYALYVSPEERDRNERRLRGRKGRVRGIRGVRGQSARGRGYSTQGHRGTNPWTVGQPLKEIWTSDYDVPPKWKKLARDVMRRRQMRMHDAARAEPGDASESEDDEILDASNGADNLPGLEGRNHHFEWSTMETFQGQEEHFRPERTGSVHAVNSAYDAFRLYWGNDVLELIVTETNNYATKITSAAFQSEWFPTNRHEILCLFAFWIMLGIIRMPTVTSCFSVDPLLKTEVFRRIFTRRRYETLNRAFNFNAYNTNVKNSNPSNTSAGNFDQLRRLRPILLHLNSRFQANYILSQNICIDETFTLWKGGLNFKQYTRDKVTKYGIKTFELCESATGYLWSFIVYSGRQPATDLEQSPGVIKRSAVVKKLIGPLLNKGYRLFMDKWYNSPRLARFLKANGTDCVGTLSPLRRDVPLLVSKAPLNRGEFIARHSGDVSILSWQDTKRETMISTCHGSSTALPTVPSRPKSVPFKPQVVLDYSKFIGGADRKDEMLEPYLLDREHCTKWYMKLFKRYLNVSILNSRTLLQSSTRKHHDHLAFRLQLVDSILTNHLSQCPKSRSQTVAISRSAHQQPGRLVVSTHWPVLLGRTDNTAARNRNFYKRCVVCLREGRKDQRSSYCCETCGVPLCIRNCFKVYHTTP